MSASSGKGVRDFGSDRSPKSSLALAAKRLNLLCVFGTVSQVDYDAGKCRIKIGDPTTEDLLETEWLSFACGRQANTRKWSAPEIGEWVVAVCPGGDPTLGFIIASRAKELYPHEALTEDVERATFYSPGTNDPLLLEDQHRILARRRRWVAPHGEFRQEVGGAYDGSTDPQSVIRQDGESLIFRVGATQMVIKDGSISLSVNGQDTELIMTPETITGHVQKKGYMRLMADKFDAAIDSLGIFTVLADKIESIVAGKGRHTLTAALSETAIEDNGIVRVTKNSVTAYLKMQKSKILVAADGVISTFKTSCVEIYESIVSSRVLGSASHVTPGAIVLATPVLVCPTPPYPGVPGSDPGATYAEPDAPQEALNFSVPQIPEPAPLPPAPIVEKGKIPYTPTA